MSVSFERFAEDSPRYLATEAIRVLSNDLRRVVGDKAVLDALITVWVNGSLLLDNAASMRDMLTTLLEKLPDLEKLPEMETEFAAKTVAGRA